ncbi:MAG TPA: amino acid adenylation domain-containing protein [Polyangiales bacterium]|nr:amino acid adenylation domain-containing protein [Polyangiales bacterium]
MHARFEAHADRTPDAIAVVCEGESLNYRELDRRANAVAHKLAELGPDARVGLCSERSIAMIVGLLGVLKAGAAYVPLDPKWPAARIDEVLRDSGARVLLADAALHREVISIDNAQAERLPPRALETSLAYLIYTSGSTGKPKGVAIEHRQLCSYLDGIEARLPLEDVRSIAFVSTVAADLGHTGLFGALCAGRTLHVIPSERTFDPDAFAERMHEQRIDALKIVPSHLGALLEATQPERVLPRRVLILGGEAASPALLAKVRALAPDCVLINHYGPTETTVGALTHRASEERELPLGRPLPNVRAYVLDASLSPLPAGTAGELFLAGESVARGYHKRPQLTAERFVPDPLACTPGARMYRTGDRARFRDDGSLEFLGRMDHQLKVRGNRVELGEIEARIRALPGVRDAVVIAREQRLVGYVVGELEGVLAALAQSLPDYMVPSALIALPALPLTANGKIDRNALPSEQPTAPQRVVAPTGPVETALVEIWRSVLGVDELSVHDNFFARGGDSIRSLQVIARANQRGIKLSPKHLFEHPTIAQVAKVAMQGPAKIGARAAAFALSGLSPSEQARALGELASLEDAYPLSPMQEGMLFHTRLNPGSGMYLMQQHYQWNGALDVARVTEAWRLVAMRHAILRTSFVWDELERPLQRVHKMIDMAAVVHHVDLRGLEPARQEAELRATLEAELAQGLDMTRAPLLRLRIFQLDAQSYRIVRSFHHILTDDWCFSVLMMECLQFYAALGEGRTLSLPEPRPYRDYIAWLAGKDSKGAERFYREQLRGFTSATSLGIEHAVADTKASGVGDAFFELSPEQSARLMALASEHALTPNTFVQGAWAVLLSRYAQTEDVLFGVTVAGRPTELPGVETIVGLFINSLPLRVDASPAQPLLPFLKELLANNYRVREHEHPPLVSIQGWSELPAGEALFKSLIVFENAPQDERLGDQVSEVEVAFDGDRVHTNYPMTVVAYPGERIGVRLSFDRRWFEQDAVERMLQHLRGLLEDMATRPASRLGELTMLGADERASLLTPARELALHEDYVALFEAQVARTPNAIAVRSGARALSYDALNRAANRVAHGLRAEGIRADAVVAVLEQRDIELLISALGVLKAGAAYLPLDPAHPPVRLANTVAHSGAQLMLTEADFPSARVLTRERCATRPDVNLGLKVHPRQLAYVIFTSGSTGVPKGAMVEHDGMLNNVWGKLPALELSARDVVAQTASQCFDISVWQLLSPLLAGACVEILGDETVRDPRLLLEHVDRVGVTIMELVPSLLRELIAASEEHSSALASVRWMLPTGEALPPELARRWFARFPRIPLLNAYGPAECADDVALHRLTQAPEEHLRQVPIGKAVPNTRLYVTSGEELAPRGVTGELCVSGIGVGRGYVGDAARTAASFVPDPFAAIAGERMYRTGDLARRASDGTLTFVGRRDHQVKLRGYRIELGEIEARLGQLAGVEQAVVIARGAQLVAYLVAEHAEPAIRGALERELPAYMIPSAFVFLEALPLNGNGKVDRARLPAPTQVSTELELPRTQSERALAAIWSEVLGVSQVGRQSNFFALGGHSLLATLVASRVRKALQIELPLRTLFDAPTLAQLACALDQRASTQDTPLLPVPRAAPLPLSFAQQRLWFLSKLESDPAAYNMSAAVKVEGALDYAQLKAAFGALIARHEALRTVFVEQAGVPMQRVGDAEPDCELRELHPAALTQAAEAHVARAFDLERGPLVRLLVLRLGEREHALVLALHHIVADGWSLNVLVAELAELYAARLERRPSSLPALPIQYADFAVWQRRWLEGAREAQLGYWRERLRGASELDLRPDRARTSSGSLSAVSARHTQQLPREWSAQLRRESTLFMSLLAAYKVALSRRSGQTDLLVGTDVANRPRAESEGVIGFFVNLLALRTDLQGDPSLRELVARVRETTLDAYANQDVPFEQVVDAVRPARERDRHPLVQSLFVLQNTPASELTLPGVTFSALELERETSRFDLGVFAEELDDGLRVVWKYRSDLFDASTIEALAADFQLVLHALIERPEQKLSELAAAQRRERSRERRGRLREVRTRDRALVVTQGELPLSIEPNGSELDVAAWAASERAFLEEKLLRHGALLLRGFGLRTVQDFERVAGAICGQLYGEYGDLPREQSGKQVYHSTPYPEDETILFHNESSHLPRWPGKQFFFCVQPSLEGGATPLVDCRRMVRELEPQLVERFRSLGLRYVRNFTPGFDVSWQDFFKTEQRAAVEARCAREGMTCSWLPGGGLRTVQHGPGVITHPKTGEASFFNQVQLHHPDYLSEPVRASLRALIGDDGYPRNVSYGDGSPIDRETTRAIGEAYERCAVRLPWQAGDLIVLDNMLVAHARDPYRGARKIVVAMGEMREGLKS